MLSINKYLAENHSKTAMFHKFSPRIVCKDGFTLWVQASSSHYCEPQNDTGPYTEVEVNYPSEEVECLAPYASGYERASDEIYHNVPVAVVERLIELHGGV